MLMLLGGPVNITKQLVYYEKINIIHFPIHEHLHMECTYKKVKVVD